MGDAGFYRQNTISSHDKACVLRLGMLARYMELVTASKNKLETVFSGKHFSE
jgi:hypothetical protein